MYAMKSSRKSTGTAKILMVLTKHAMTMMNPIAIIAIWRKNRTVPTVKSFLQSAGTALKTRVAGSGSAGKTEARFLEGGGEFIRRSFESSQVSSLMMFGILENSLEIKRLLECKKN